MTLMEVRRPDDITFPSGDACPVKLEVEDAVSKRNEIRERLDKAMVARGIVDTRSRAQDLIRRGLVRVNGIAQTSPSLVVDAAHAIALAPGHAGQAFVSRGAEKLEAALAHFGFSAADRVVLDVGASTGGFTQVLLRAGAARVYAVDVGHDQLHAAVRADPRVISREGLDARALTPEHLPEPVDAIVADVSFISLSKVLPQAFARAAPHAWLVALIKPQFEVGRAHVGKGGIVRDAAARDAAVARIRSFIEGHAVIEGEARWRVAGVLPSPIAGKSGNLEFLIGATR